MKLTKSKLRQIIKEELGTLREAQLEDGGTLMEPVDPPQDPNVGGTLLAPADTPQAASAGNKKLALVAKELQILLKKIQQEL
ncbi:MAG TPA: hypothetical protein EYN67_08515 [Flavobacteriales bacterium]|nr:hypothetical protein [Flavobacteriales bacterium]